MKATMKSILEASGAFAKLYRAPLPLQCAYDVQRLGAAMQAQLDFFHRSREQIAADFHAEGGDLNRLTGDDRQAAAERLDELLSVEAEIDRGPVTLPLCLDVAISPADLAALAPFVRFGEGKHGKKGRRT